MNSGCLLLILALSSAFISAAHGEEIDTRTADDAALRWAFNAGLVELEADETDYGVQVDRFGHSIVLRARGPRDAPEIKLNCVLCTAGEMLSLARSLGAMVWAAKTKRDTAWVMTSGSPAGDAFFLDGVPVVPEGSKHPVVPGKHRVERRGNRTTSHAAVVIEPGRTLDLTTVETREASNSRSKVRPAVALLGLGLTTAALGGIFLWLDGNCADVQCKDVHGVGGTGWGLLAGGIAIDAATLIWLFWPEKPASKRSITQ
ncbi:MAG: hypothetical protein QNJ97_03435 [Myxococcota bacterium]|nr:hypothetical protein [Myxococcota bacterium]